MKASDALFQSTDIDNVRAYLVESLARLEAAGRVRNPKLARALIEATVEVLGDFPADSDCWNFPMGETADQRVQRLVKLANPIAQRIASAA
jgi:hypothetical protein